MFGQDPHSPARVLVCAQGVGFAHFSELPPPGTSRMVLFTFSQPTVSVAFHFWVADLCRESGGQPLASARCHS